MRSKTTPTRRHMTATTLAAITALSVGMASTPAAAVSDEDPTFEVPRWSDVVDHVTDSGNHAVVAGQRSPEFSWWGQSGPVVHEQSSLGGIRTSARLGSITKLVVAVAVMKRVEAGDWTLGTTVGEIDASWGEKWSGITLEQLLSHGSGIPNYFGGDSNCFTELSDVESSVSSTLDESDTEDSYPTTASAWKEALAQPVSIRDVLTTVSDAPLVFEPGTKHCYSNTNYALLGVLLEKHHGAPLATILHRDVFRPLGMHDTYLATEPGFRGPHIVGRYTLGGETVLLEDTHPSIYGAAGALVATPLDMSKLHKALGEGTLLAKETVAEMRRPRSFMVDEGFVYGGYGLGTMAVLIACNTFYEVAYGHNGATMGTLSNSYSNADGTRSSTVSVSGRDDDAPIDKPTPAQVAAGVAMNRGYAAICPNTAEPRSTAEKPSNLLLELRKVRPIQDVTPHNGHQTAQSGQKLPKK